jgi:hypothetical protein
MSSGSSRQHHDKTMRAVLWEGKPFHVTVADVPIPKIQAPEDAIVQMTSAAICGSDLHNYHGLLGSATPGYSLDMRPWELLSRSVRESAI